MPGPPKTPTATLALRGSWRAKKRKDEPQPQLGVPGAPEWLSSAGRDAYNAIVAQLTTVGLLAIVDGTALARYADLVAEYIGADEVNAKVKISAELGKLERQFGLTPAARASLGMGEKKPPVDARAAKFLKKAS